MDGVSTYGNFSPSVIAKNPVAKVDRASNRINEHDHGKHDKVNLDKQTPFQRWVELQPTELASPSR